MTNSEPSHGISWVPATIGVFLWAAATGLLLEEAIHAGRYDVATLATPILTASTVAAACLAHLRFSSWRIIGGTGFLLLALLGSTIMASGTLGRLAETKDAKAADVQKVNRTYGEKSKALEDAKASAKVECRSIGPKCQQWQARVDTLTKELAGISVRSVDAKADAIVRLAVLVGGNGERTRAIFEAIDPITLPLFLELGSVGMFAGAFRRRKPSKSRETVTLATVAVESPERVARVFSRDDALRDFLTLKASNSQSFLANRWQVSEGTVSKWLSGWETDGRIERKRTGRSMHAALAPPARKALPSR